MAEDSVKNGGTSVDPYRAPDADMRGWYFIDALDGRRWLGRLAPRGDESRVETELLSLLEDEIILCPAFEVPPERAHTAVLVPQAQVGVGPDGKPTQVMGASIQPVITFKMEIGLFGEMKRNGLVPQRVRRASSNHVADYQRDHRMAIRKLISTILEMCKPEVPDVLKNHDQPREKVR